MELLNYLAESKCVLFSENSGNIEIIMDGTKQLAIYEVFRDPMFDSIDEATLQFGKGGNIQLRFTGEFYISGYRQLKK